MKWISVKDQLPILDEFVLCYFEPIGNNKKYNMKTGKMFKVYTDDSFNDNDDIFTWTLIEVVTHWMPLPEGPE